VDALKQSTMMKGGGAKGRGVGSWKARVDMKEPEGKSNMLTSC
jgi:hypothetical protein